MPRLLYLLMNPFVWIVLALVWSGTATAKSADEIDAGANQAIERLYKESPAAKELGAKASGMLIFPDILLFSIQVCLPGTYNGSSSASDEKQLFQ